MPRRYVAIDLETAKVLPEWTTDLLAHRPLGIACAAAVFSDRKVPVTWHGVGESGKPAPQMTQSEAQSLVRDLSSYVSDGYTLLSWNGLAFDFDVLAEESGLLPECASLALDHVDMMFHAVCCLGHRVSLDKAAQGLGVRGKLGGMSGRNVPQLWASGRHDDVLKYNVQDARVSLQVAEAAERHGQLTWITQRGAPRSMPLSDGWQCVRAASQLPLPDTSWMTSPPSRDSLMSWLPHA
jgi:hypothetical protein